MTCYPAYVFGSVPCGVDATYHPTWPRLWWAAPTLPGMQKSSFQLAVVEIRDVVPLADADATADGVVEIRVVRRVIRECLARIRGVLPSHTVGPIKPGGDDLERLGIQESHRKGAWA